MTQNTENGQFTFSDLCAIEPKLKDLCREIKQSKDWRDQRDWNVWQQYKDQLSQLVGWQASTTDTRLKSPEAYDTVYQTIWHKWTYPKPVPGVSKD